MVLMPRAVADGRGPLLCKAAKSSPVVYISAEGLPWRRGKPSFVTICIPHAADLMTGIMSQEDILLDFIAEDNGMLSSDCSLMRSAA